MIFSTTATSAPSSQEARQYCREIRDKQRRPISRLINYISRAALLCAVAAAANTTSAAAPIGPPRGFPPPPLQYLVDGDVRVALCPEWGGAICEVRKGSRTYIDDNDGGRLIQCALFSDSDKAYNPTQGGGAHNWPAGYVEFRKINNREAYSRSLMRQWEPRPGDPTTSTVTLEQWTRLRDGVISVRYRWTNNGSHVQGAVNQEGPVVYMMPKPTTGPLSFNYVHAYGGIVPWSGDESNLLHFDITAHADDPSSGTGVNFRASENWIAMTDQSGDGITLFDPEFCDAHARRSYGIAPKFKMIKPYEIWGADDPLGRNVRENTVYIVPGDWRAARKKLAALYINRTKWDLAQKQMSGWLKDRETSSILTSPAINLPAACYAGVSFRYRINPGTPADLKVAFKHDQDLTFVPDRTKAAPVIADGAWHDTALDLSDLRGWTGAIRSLSFSSGTSITLPEIASVSLRRRDIVRWDFNETGEDENWFPIRDGDMLTAISNGSCLVGKAETPGPHHYIQPYFHDAPPSDGTQPRMACWPNLDIDAAKIRKIRVRLRTHDTTAPVRIAWHNNTDHGRDRNYVRTPMITLKPTASADKDGFQTVEADLSKSPRWRGRIQQLMLAPVVGRDASFEIDWIELRP